MSKAEFTSKRGEFIKKNASFVDMVMGHMALDIEVAIKTTSGTPVDTGDMKAETRHFRSPSGGFRVESDKEYAAAQEAGSRNGIQFKHYTTQGTSAGWFHRAISSVWERKDSYIQEAAKALNL